MFITITQRLDKNRSDVTQIIFVQRKNYVGNETADAGGEFFQELGVSDYICPSSAVIVGHFDETIRRPRPPWAGSP
jgi:hypothetical protein